ncbi:MAG: four helix bundle protein [Sphingobacteriales bacterium]|nr:four helix bundle protein [Sphingobacteriales bacterium]
MKENVIAIKTYDFALKAIKLYQHLTAEKKEFVLSKQFLRSATSIGANVEESVGGQTEKDFFLKLNIAYKEARESHYWLRLLKDSNLVAKDLADPLIADVEEIQRILGSSVKTLKTKFNY